MPKAGPNTELNSTAIIGLTSITHIPLLLDAT